MHFQAKNTFKNNYYHNTKQILNTRHPRKILWGKGYGLEIMLIIQVLLLCSTLQYHTIVF
jgi:hypothetical protein